MIDHDHNPWVVLKFGGTSVASIERWRVIEGVLRQRVAQGYLPFVVCSALGGLSDVLEQMLKDMAEGREVERALAQIEEMHHALAASMNLNAEEIIGEELSEMRQLARGALMIEEVSPRLRARVMSMGELMSTKLGAAWLNQQGLETSWQDARKMLLCADQRPTPSATANHYLSASCNYDRDLHLTRKLRSLNVQAILTQGFIARDTHDDTVLLGRGGSDTSAAYFAARLEAERLEIWTDVPGMFTTNPRHVPQARLLRHIGYQEAQELALMGAKVLHPRCIAPVAAHKIPLHVRCIQAPDMTGTIVSSDAPKGIPLVKAVSARKGITLLSCTLDRAIHNVGFLAATAECFERWKISIDMVAASETNVTFSLDASANNLTDEILDGLLADLNEICDARTLGPGAAVSLIGEHIRSILHELGPLLERFEEHHIYMISKAADDLNLTFIVDEDAADRLVVDLHAHLFGPGVQDRTFGPTWTRLFDESVEPRLLEGWWGERREYLLEETSRGTPCFVYDTDAIDQALDELSVLPVDQFLYSIKANPHPQLLQHVRDRGVGLQCGTHGELALVQKIFDTLDERVWFSPHAAEAEAYLAAFDAGVRVVVDSLHPIEQMPHLFRGREIVLRFDPGRGTAGAPFVRTAGRQGKFGIAPSDAERAIDAVTRADAVVIGLHAHAGSGLRSTQTWQDIGALLLSIASEFKDAQILNLGGGLAVPERVGQGEIDLAVVGEGLHALTTRHPNIQFWMEPGRFLVARAGVLLAQVREVTIKDERTFVTIDAGINSLIRPALYGAWHEIINLNRWRDSPRMVADIVGPLSESADVLGSERQLPATLPGDILLLANAGAYGHSMASQFNATQPAREVIAPPRSPHKPT